MTDTLKIIESTEMGSLGVYHVKRYWHKSLLKKQGTLPQSALQDEWNIDNTLLAILSLGLEQTIKHVFNNEPSFEEFENWILALNNNKLDTDKIQQFNAYIENRQLPFTQQEMENPVLSEADMYFWNEHGYVILRNAIPKEDCENAIAAICEHIEIDRHDPATWYGAHPSRQGIMVQLFQHPALEKNRQSEKIRRAYEQLWQRKDIWMNTDRVGFNPPETTNWQFPGPRMHWDVSLKQPIPFGLQGILYLADTAAHQGAFTLVPGFHNKVADWLNGLPVGADPRMEDIYALGTLPIVASAGDFIIWHHALPHGSSANTSTEPRFVQYMNLQPLDAEKHDEWI